MGEALMAEPKQTRSGLRKAVETSVDTALAVALRSHIKLSRMEALVACSLADGLTYQEIADRCHVSYHTVHSHVKAIHQKAGVSSNGKLLALIHRKGWR
jgi:DNA-binding CsgD family transcriptional regulator